SPGALLCKPFPVRSDNNRPDDAQPDRHASCRTNPHRTSQYAHYTLHGTQRRRQSRNNKSGGDKRGPHETHCPAGTGGSGGESTGSSLIRIPTGGPHWKNRSFPCRFLSETATAKETEALPPDLYMDCPMRISNVPPDVP